MSRLRAWSFLLFLPAAAVPGCIAHEEPTAVTDGEVRASLMTAAGEVEPLVIATPSGDVFFERRDWGTRCELVVHATDPVASDHRSEAKARRTSLSIRVPLVAVSDPSVQTEQRASAHAGVLYGDCSVQLGRANGDAKDDQYCSGGGTLVLEPLPAEGGRGRVRLEGVALFDVHDRTNTRRLDGVVSAVYRGTTAAMPGETRRACPP